jgi:two-component system response regulator NreC
MVVTLFLADDYQMVRQGLRALLQAVDDFRIVGEAADGPQTVRLVSRLQPDVLILDLLLPGLDGLEVTRRLARRSPRIRVLILSVHSQEAYTIEALRAGALGYVSKKASAEELVEAIRTVAVGQRYLSPPLAEHVLLAYLQKAEGKPLDPYQTLTAREREILQLTVEGNSGLEISQRLFISRRTVETHRTNLMRKLGVRNQKDLVRYAVQKGIVLTT